MKDPGVLVIGGGGHAKVVIASLQAAGRTVKAAYDDDVKRHGSLILGVSVVGPVDAALERRDLEAVVAIGDCVVRRGIVERLAMRWLTVVHPGATVHASVRLGAGTVIFAGAIVQPDSVIGSHVIVNTASTVDHDCRVGDFCHLAPGVHLAGGVTVNHGAFVGIGAVVLPSLTVGERAIVGAGAVVTRDVLPGAAAAGVPARSLRSKKP
jgi:sugar O-acyltransferase (sialic acid O-acetyltransferase NeuD family)